MTRVELGILGSFNKDKQSPFETFYVGGDGMSGYSTGYAEETIGMRGYENGSLSSSSGYEMLSKGKSISSYNAYAYDRLTLELRYPFMLGNTTIYGLGFVEAGNAWVDTKKFNPFDMKRSAGLGVRIFLRHEALCRSGCAHLPPDGGLDGYRLGLWFRQCLYQCIRTPRKGRLAIPLHPRTGVLRGIS